MDPVRSPGRTGWSLAAAVALVVAASGCSGSNGSEGSATSSTRTTTKSTTSSPTASSGTVAPNTTIRPPAPPPPIRWTPCPEKGKNLECGLLTVPLDYRDDGGPSIDLQVSRSAATDKANRLGVLLVSPGGPGITGVTFPPNFSMFASVHPNDAAAAARFDLVGLDARGTGKNVFSCGDFTPLRSADPEPDDAAEATALKDAAQTLAKACADTVPVETLASTTTATEAQDIDLLRQALGEKQLNLYGLSYGTRILGTYAGRFAQRVRATVLDAAMVPSTDGLKLAKEQMEVLDKEFTALLTRCGQDKACPFGHGDPLGAYDKLMKRWEDTPMPVKGGPPLTATQAMRGYTSAVFNTYARAGMLQALAEAEGGDATSSAKLWMSTQSSNVSASSALTHLCNDYTWPTADTLYASVVTDRPHPSRLAPAAAVSYLPCGSWPAKAHPPRGPSQGWPTRAKGAPPILVYGGTDDPSTPYQWSEQLTRYLDTATLVTRDGEGHVSLSRSKCIADASAKYLVDLELPAPGTHCPTEF